MLKVTFHVQYSPYSTYAFVNITIPSNSRFFISKWLPCDRYRGQGLGACSF